MPRKILLALVSCAAIGTWNGCSRQRAEPEGAKDDPPQEKRKGPKWEDPRKCTDLHRSAVVELDHVEVENGRLRVLTAKDPPWSAGFSEWEFEKTPLGTQIYLSTWRERSGKRGLYLSYDHQGKERRVSLVREPGPGCYWEWTEGPRVEGRFLDVLGPTGPGGPYFTIPCQAKPANGPFKGWSLTSEGADLVLAKSPKNQFTFTANINGPYSK